MALELNPLVVLGGNQGVVYDFVQNPPPPVIVSQIQPEIVFFYDNESPTNGSILLTNATTELTNFNGNFHFLTAIPMQSATGSGSDFSLIVGEDLAANGPNTVNCANINLSFSTDGNETSTVEPLNVVDRNCSAIPNNETYVFQPFQIPNLNAAFNTVTISVQRGQNAGIQKDVIVFIYGDSSSLSTPLIGIINSNGDQYTFRNTTKGNIYLMAFIQPSPTLNGNKTVVNFSTGDPEIDSSITFDDEELIKADSEAQSELEPGSKNKGCLSFFGLW